MAYTEIKERNGRKYYYRVISIRKGKKISKIRRYLGANLAKGGLSLKEKKYDKELNLLHKDRKKKLLENIKKKIIPILKRYGVKKAGIFGSYAVGKAKKNSDVDILIKPPKGMGFGFIGLEIKLSEALKKKVDLVSYNGLSPYLKNKILNQEIKII
ncbi:MAG TPA: nucleotidyltransferase domain-containing protein [Candidatus Nanoarchaeia archaeon]|nr:nucleotidyltransferase domain-containing protein [Candidatus Nanoarchaeia archaeon]